MATFIVTPDQSDPLRFMHRWDLYQWADEKKIEYAKDAPAEVMKTLIRAHGEIPTRERFNPIHDQLGNVVGWKYKRLPKDQAPRSRHADADEEETRKLRAKQRAELEALNPRQLTRRVKDQFGPKVLDRDLSRDDMIALFVGEAEEATKPAPEMTVAPPVTGDTPQENFPDWLLDSLTPMQLVKICKQYGLQANIREGKKALLEKVRGHAA